MARLAHPVQLLLGALTGWINHQQREVIEYLQAENRVLREQLGPRRLRFTDHQRVRLAAKAKNLPRHVLREIGSIVSPDTLLAWHRHLIVRKDDGHPRRGPGRPPVPAEIRQLVVRMATENRQWGYTRIQGALANLGHDVGRGTVANILRQHGMDPAPERQKRTTWHEFLKTQWDVLGAVDVFGEVWTATSLTRYLVRFIMNVATCCVEVGSIGSETGGAWAMYNGHQLTDVEGVLAGKSFLRHDRDRLFAEAFGETLATAGVGAGRPPPCSAHPHRARCRTNHGLVSESDDRVRRPFRDAEPFASWSHTTTSRIKRNGTLNSSVPLVRDCLGRASRVPGTHRRALTFVPSAVDRIVGQYGA